MKDYFFTLIGASLCVMLISLLAPPGGSSKYVRLLTSLFLICVIVSPVGGWIENIRDIANGKLPPPEWGASDGEDAEEELQNTLNSASKDYFLQSLTQMLEAEFSISAGEIHCNAVWREAEDGQLLPKEIHVLLSGAAIWKDPKKIESYIYELLGCSCIIAVA